MSRQSVILIVALLAVLAGAAGFWAYDRSRTVVDVTIGGQGFTVQQR